MVTSKFHKYCQREGAKWCQKWNKVENDAFANWTKIVLINVILKTLQSAMMISNNFSGNNSGINGNSSSCKLYELQLSYHYICKHKRYYFVSLHYKPCHRPES